MSQQLKVFEFAKEIGVETLVLMDKIREWKLPVRSHMATLDEDLMQEIRDRIASAEVQAEQDKPKKKAVRKKAATTAEAKPKAAVKPKAKKSVVAKVTKASGAATATVTEVEAPKEAAATPAAKPKAARVRAPQASVIRRKAGELEARAAEKAAQVEAELLAREQGIEPQPLVEGAETDGSQATTVSADPAGTAAAPRRQNIVGRMDLRRVSQAPAQNTSGAAPGSPRVPRSAPRNIRPGFYADDPTLMPPPPPIDDDFAERKLKEERAKKKATTGAREEVQQTFTATEFRKREVIFQPKKKKVAVARESKKTQLTTPAAHKRVIKIHGTITLSNLAAEMGLKAPALMKKLMQEGVQASMQTVLDFDTVALIAPEFGFETQNVQRSETELIDQAAFGDLKATPITRSPVVTVMGHVDHGKTSLLDSIRKAKVASGEAGGITQHIGAYSVQLPDGHAVTFIDTPGHEAFTAMRARGANVTDIVIIVVAADDGVMPQTAEAINHAKAAGVPIIVAINKMDKPGANVERIKQQMTEFELVPEEWGGTTIFCPVSALKGDGIKELLEQIVLVSEMQELTANPGRSGTGIVIESRVERGRGCVATILVRDGTVKIGQVIVAGLVVGRVRSMQNDRGQVVKEAGPGMPVEVLGLPEPPMAGDRIDVAKDESAARELAERRKSELIAEEVPSSKMTLEQLFARVKSGDVKELALVLKADVAGSLEAVKGMLDKLGSAEVKVKLIHSAVGGVTESDVLLASTSNGVIVGFNVRPDSGASRMAKEKAIEIKSYSIIYELIDDLKKALSGLLTPEVVEKSMGSAQVRETFTVPKMGMIAGCHVSEGKISRNHLLRLVRDGTIVYEGKVGSLRRFKDDVKEVAAGFECGIGIENFNDIKVGDVIEAYVKEEQAREL